MITRRAFNSRFMAASTGAAFAISAARCGGAKARYALSQEENGLARMTTSALGANVSITVNIPEALDATYLCDAAMDRLDALDAIFNPRLETSELSRLNAAGRLETPSDFLLALNQFSREMKIMTNDTFNTSARPMRLLYAKMPQPSGDDLAQALDLGKGYAIAGSRGIRLTRPGTQIDFENCIQGFAVDILTAQLLGSDVTSGLINVGNAHYAIGTRPDGKPWIIELGGATVPLENAALVTSTPHTGTRIDPRVGALPALHENISVIASQAVMADALATAFSLMPISEITARRAAILGGGLTQRLDIFITNLSGQLVALRG